MAKSLFRTLAAYLTSRRRRPRFAPAHTTNLLRLRPSQPRWQGPARKFLGRASSQAANPSRHRPRPQDRSPACAACQVGTWAACLCRTSFHHAPRRNARDEFEARIAKLKQQRPVLSWLRNRDARWVKPRHHSEGSFGSCLLRHATVRDVC